MKQVSIYSSRRHLYSRLPQRRLRDLTDNFGIQVSSGTLSSNLGHLETGKTFKRLYGKQIKFLKYGMCVCS